jgi:hypothetical protein
MKYLTKYLIYTVFLLPVLMCHVMAQELVVSPDPATEGYITLKWNELEVSKDEVSLQLASDESFATLVNELTLRNQQQVHLSGLSDGRYFARVLDNNGASLTDSVSFTVQHRDVRIAWSLFFTGLSLFVLLIFIMRRFTRR